MINNLIIPNIRLFVFGTLRVGGRLDYYMEGSSPLGLYYTRGQLMESENGSAYVDFNEKDAATIGELHHINYYCLQRINHLESNWGEFPKGYDLGIMPIWIYDQEKGFNFDENQKTSAFCYLRRGTSKIKGGDWMNRKKPIEEIGRLLREEITKPIYHNDLTTHMIEYLK